MSHHARWIIGRGLLGKAIERTRDDSPFHTQIPWSDPLAARESVREAAGVFAASSGPLEIYWCAGQGVTSSTEVDLRKETEFFVDALQTIGELLERRDVRFFLASSVGGAYARSWPPPFTESTEPAPASAYGRAKLTMERTLTEATERHGWRAFIARITNLYGPGQNMAKGQGLISVITDSYVSGRPVSLYVHLDTLRDYIYEDDCAAVVSAGMERLSKINQGVVVTKIVGSMAALSIGALLGESTRLRRQRSRIVLGPGPSTGQSSDLRVRSQVWPELDALVRTSLPEGLDKVFRARLAAAARGRSLST